jgi:pyridoxal phosphate enzyme (YggS family)
MGGSSIADNVARLRERVGLAARRSGSEPSDIVVVAVTKTVEPARIREAVACGLTVVGENRVQELLEKYPAVQGCEWHMIGHLQSNKAKYLPGKVSMIQSLDSAGLARELDVRARAAGVTVSALVEVNISGESAKTGIPPEAVPDFLETMAAWPNVLVKGLMAIGPLTEDRVLIRKCFERMRRIYVDNLCQKADNVAMEHLSMGMSHDFELAIESGSNMIRVGTAIFGARN